MTVYGYARVSTDGQLLSAQLAELKAAKCAKVFQEKISGARSDRKQLMRLMAVLAKGDVLVVTRLDRLARSTRDLLNLLGTIAESDAAGDRQLDLESIRDANGSVDTGWLNAGLEYVYTRRDVFWWDGGDGSGRGGLRCCQSSCGGGHRPVLKTR